MIYFKNTNSVITSLEKIHAIWGVIENAKIVPEWEQELIKIARLRSGVFSTRIEGSQIDLKQAEKLEKGEKVRVRERDKQELKNYLSVLEYIESKETDPKITEKHVFDIHSIVTHKILSKGLQNKYRDLQNAVYDQDGTIQYMPPESKDVSIFLKDLIKYINTQTDISILIRAALLHHWFVIIHPFIDGNGRTARAITQMFLYQQGFNTKKYFSLEEYYDSDLQNYYKAIHIGSNFYDVQEKGIESTHFIEYFLNGMLYELERLKNQIEHIKDDEYFEKQLLDLDLTNRQIHFVLFIKERRKVKSSDFIKTFKVSLATIKRELNHLIAKRVVKLTGKGKNSYYELNMS